MFDKVAVGDFDGFCCWVFVVCCVVNDGMTCWFELLLNRTNVSVFPVFGFEFPNLSLTMLESFWIGCVASSRIDEPEEPVEFCELFVWFLLFFSDRADVACRSFV